MALFVEVWICLTIIGTITVPVVWTNSCVNPFDREMVPNIVNGKIYLGNVIKILEHVLDNKGIQDSSILRTIDDCNNNPACYIELKVYKESYLELCVTPRDTQRVGADDPIKNLKNKSTIMPHHLWSSHGLQQLARDNDICNGIKALTKGKKMVETIRLLVDSFRIKILYLFPGIIETAMKNKRPNVECGFAHVTCTFKTG
ncbi:uncharacterized protein LOC125655728 isoform X4 [Ostrea edulis]|uniref:uncharacterized protein LOC125655728 isoform X4 n=1 Tax=Ostrea edulis TaxID=37623 RepID=UPI0024AFB749|nr:uncharacterized protein LOC125655728 isoform X4 [Ostrea edulis]